LLFVVHSFDCSVWFVLRSVTSHRFGRISTAGRQPRIALSVEARVIRIEVNKATLNQKVANLEHIAPPARVRHPGAPGAVAMDTSACALACESIRTRHNPVEGGVIVQDAFN